jgi:RNA polymerase sigma-70 factor (ECF subfamily)
MSGERDTSATLLGRLAQSGAADHAAWAEFVARYGPAVYAWCAARRLQAADAEDVTQQVLLKLANRMKTFTYDPSRRFRAWLRTVTENAIRDFHAAGPPDRPTGDSAMHAALASVAATEDLHQRLAAEYDRELLDAAMQRVQARVAAHTWEAFRLTALEGVPAGEVAQRLNMKVCTVYEARSSVVKKLRAERAALEGEA